MHVHRLAPRRGVPAVAALFVSAVTACSDVSRTTAITPSTDGPDFATTAVGAPAKIQLTSWSTRLTKGSRQQFTVFVADSAGRVIAAPPMTWSSGTTSIVTVDQKGNVVAVAPGKTTIFARAGTATGGGPWTAVDVTIEASATSRVARIAPSVPSITLGVGGSSPLAFTAIDTAGHALTACTWSTASRSPAVATFTNNLVRGVQLGLTYAVAACDGHYAAVPVLVEPASVTPMVVALQSLQIAPATAAVVVGSTITLTATTIDSSARPLAGRSVVWTSSSPAIATVAADGQVTGRAAGTATITAMLDGVSAVVPVIVTDSTSQSPNNGTPLTLTPSAPAGTRVDSVPLVVRRFDNQSGTALVSNGIPLPPGRLTTGQLSRVRVVVEGQEVPVAIAPLAGKFADGSLRGILLQFRYDVPAAGTLPGALLFDQPRTLTDIPVSPASHNTAVVALPTSASYLTSTGVGGQLLPVTETAPASRMWDDDYRAAIERNWAQYGAALNIHGIAMYEGPLTAYQWWLRTADPVWWYRANRMTASYAAYAAAAPNFAVAPWMSNTEELVVDYYSTGDPSIRTMIGALADNMAGQTRDAFNEYPGGSGWRLGGPRGDDRMRARALMAMMDATVVDAPYAKWFNASALAKGITDVLSTQHADGSFGGINYLGGQKNYMVGLLLTAIVRYHEEFNPDPRIPTAVKRAVDYMWDTQWDAGKQGFKYVSVDSTSEGIGQTKPQPSLAALSIPSFSFVAVQTGDPKYLRAIEDMEAGVRTNRRNWTSWVEQFDQAYYRVFNHIARVQGVVAKR